MAIRIEHVGDVAIKALNLSARLHEIVHAAPQTCSSGRPGRRIKHGCTEKVQV